MVNILSYVGMNMQSEVCLWTLLGLLRTIFDATLFKVNANLKQVWQMSMPCELSMPVQRVLRTMISGVMLVQCFTVYVYLASYIVLLYPVFLEERPTLVLPWLLLAAIRKLLCELTSLALGLGTCVLLGPARPPCIKFVVFKIASITPAFYMWMLTYSYYDALKVASAFKTFPAVLPPNDHDYGLELAVRRRRTKSLFDEEQLRRKLIASCGERHSNVESSVTRIKIDHPSRMAHSTDTRTEVDKTPETLDPLTIIPNRISETGSCEDWTAREVLLPRDTDRILEQFGQMMLRIGVYLQKEDRGSVTSDILKSPSVAQIPQHEKLECTDDTDTPPLVGNSKRNTALYLREYPQIFMKRPSDVTSTEKNDGSMKNIQSINGSNIARSHKHAISHTETISQRKLHKAENNFNEKENTPILKHKEAILKTDSVGERQHALSHVTIKSASIGSFKEIHANQSNVIQSSENNSEKTIDHDSSLNSHNNLNQALTIEGNEICSTISDDKNNHNIKDQTHSNSTLEVKEKCLKSPTSADDTITVDKNSMHCSLEGADEENGGLSSLNEKIISIQTKLK